MLRLILSLLGVMDVFSTTDESRPRRKVPPSIIGIGAILGGILPLILGLLLPVGWSDILLFIVALAAGGAVIGGIIYVVDSVSHQGNQDRNS